MATPFVPYHPGTLAVTNGSNDIVGTGTNFLAYDPYDVLIIDGYFVVLDVITDATHATAKFNYLGATGSGKAYEWIPQPDVTKALTLYQALQPILSGGNVAAFASLASAADKLGYFTGAGTMDVADFKASARSMLGLTSAVDKFPYFTGADTAALATITAAARTLLSKAEVAAMLTYLGGQPLDPDLAAIAALATSANRLLGTDGAGNYSLLDATAARLLLSVYSQADINSALALRLLKASNLADLADKAEARTNLGLAWELIGAATPTAAASVIWTDLSAFKSLRLRGTVAPSVSAGVGLQLSTDNGATWKAGAADYRREGLATVSGAAPVNIASTASYFFLNTVQNQAPGETANFVLEMDNPSGGRVNMQNQMLHLGATDGSLIVTRSAANTAFIGRFNALLIALPGATMSGSLLLEGVRG